MREAYYRYRPSPFWGMFAVIRTLFVVLCVLIATFAVVGYAAGWIRFDHSDTRDTTTIEIETGEIKATAEDAVDKTKNLLD